MAFEEYWNESHKKYFTGKIIYDNWLDKYLDKISKCKTKILDLGCGEGNDTLYLIEKGYEVISLDYSKEALDIVKNNIRDSITVLADISKKLPFEDNSFDIIVADLSLHYFDLETSKKIMMEIKRILTKHGCLLARVNSIYDLNYGANQGTKIEDDFYYVSGYNKRFFSLDSATSLFSLIGETKAMESNMLRYSKPKKVIEVECVK
jgi:SAM-dependent methyltransferase